MKKRRSIPQFKLRKETIQRLGVEELAAVMGGGTEFGCTGACCVGCDTDNTLVENSTQCKNRCTCCHDMNTAGAGCK